MELFKEFILKYDKLPKCIDRDSMYHQSNSWEVLKKHSELYFEGSAEKIDFLWQSILFSLFSKIIYNYSIEHYKYIDDYIKWEFKTENLLLQKIYLRKLNYFIEDVCQNRLKKEYDFFINHSRENMKEYVYFFIQIPSNMDIPYCNINFKELIINNIQEIEFINEFSNQYSDLSFIFLNTLRNQLIRQ